MAFSYIQGQANHSSQSSLIISLNPTVFGNLVVVNFYVSNPGQVTSVTDNKGNTYVRSVAEVTLPNGAAANQYYGVQRVGGTTSLTIQLSSVQDVTAALNEYLGGYPTNGQVFDNAVVNTGTGTSASVSLSPSSSGELIDAGLMVFSGGINPSSVYTNGAFDQSNHTTYTQFKLSGTTSETAPVNWTSSSAWAEIATAFIPAPVFAHIQSAYNFSFGTNFTFNLDQAAAQGNLLVINFQFDGLPASINITDNVSLLNIYSRALGPVSYNSSNRFSYQYYGVQVTGGATSVTVSWAGAHSVWMTVDEFSGGEKSNATVFDTSVSTTGHTDTGGGVAGWGSLTTVQAPAFTIDPTYISGSGYAPLLTPNNASNLVISAFFGAQDFTSNDTGIVPNGYLQSIPRAPTASVFTIYRLTASSYEAMPASWEPAMDFAIIGGSYKSPSIPGAKLIHKTHYPIWKNPVSTGPVYDANYANLSHNNNKLIYVDAIPATTQGNLLVINIGCHNANVSSITDNVGNVYARAAFLNSSLNGIRLEKWYGVQINGGATTITVTYNGTTDRQHNYNEYTGTAKSNATVLDKVSTLTGRTSGSPSFIGFIDMSVPPFTPSQSGGIIDVDFDRESEPGTELNGYEWQLTDSSYSIGNAFYNPFIDVHLGDMYKVSSSTAETAPISTIINQSSNYNEIAAAFNPAPASTDILIIQSDNTIASEFKTLFITVLFIKTFDNSPEFESVFIAEVSLQPLSIGFSELIGHLETILLSISAPPTLFIIPIPDNPSANDSLFIIEQSAQDISIGLSQGATASEPPISLSISAPPTLFINVPDGPEALEEFFVVQEFFENINFGFNEFIVDGEFIHSDIASFITSTDMVTTDENTQMSAPYNFVEVIINEFVSAVESAHTARSTLDIPLKTVKLSFPIQTAIFMKLIKIETH